MGRKRHTPEQIIHKLRQAEVELSKGATVPQAAKKIGVTEQTYYRWRSEYGGMRGGSGEAAEDAGDGYQRTLKEEVTLVVHLSPDELRAAIAQFIDCYNRLRLHEALKNVTPDDVWHGQREEILARRRALKVKTVLARRYYNRGLTQQSAEGAETPEPVASSTPQSVPF